MICTEIIDSYRKNSVAAIQRFGGKLLKGVGLVKERTTSMRKDCWIRWKDSSLSCHFSALNSITCRLWWDLRKAIQLHAMQFLLNAWRLNDGSGLPVLVTVIATVEDAQRRDWWMVICAPAAAHTSAVARRWKCHSPRISNRSDAQNQWPKRPRPTRRNHHPPQPLLSTLK